MDMHCWPHLRKASHAPGLLLMGKPSGHCGLVNLITGKCFSVEKPHTILTAPIQAVSNLQRSKPEAKLYRKCAVPRWVRQEQAVVTHSFSPDDKLLVVLTDGGGFNSFIQLYDVCSGRYTISLPHSYVCSDLATALPLCLSSRSSPQQWMLACVCGAYLA